jgi:hypothetical protein
MSKKNPLRDGGSFRGSDTSTISEIGFNSNIPPSAITALEQETVGLIHGTATLTIHVKDGHLIRYATGRERSYVPGRPMTGGAT